LNIVARKLKLRSNLEAFGTIGVFAVRDFGRLNGIFDGNCHGSMTTKSLFTRLGALAALAGGFIKFHYAGPCPGGPFISDGPFLFL